jgi:hypothetical protein
LGFKKRPDGSKALFRPFIHVEAILDHDPKRNSDGSSREVVVISFLATKNKGILAEVMYQLAST